MDKRDEIVSNLTLELRRGTLILSVLSQLFVPQYGYSLIQCLNASGVQIDIGTHCFAGWKSRGGWKADGRWEKAGRAGIIRSVRMGRLCMAFYVKSGSGCQRV